MKDSTKQNAEQQNSSKLEEKNLVNVQYNSPELVEVQGTPFTLARENSTAKWKITLGLKRVVENEFIDIKSAKAWITRKPWNLIIAAAITAYDVIQQNRQWTNIPEKNNNIQ